MNERAARPTPDIVASQRRAGDPSASAWVEANAGSGKTHVLTERVLRLLLSGVAPENLLCLTYTKAAAAEMRRRVSLRLGEWAVMEEPELVKALVAIDERQPDADMLLRARTLFGHALETPGGLKINTIHAFCESVLHRFPLEAQVPFGFAVIEEGEQAELIRAARDKVMAEGLEGRGPAAPAVATLFNLMSDSQIESAVANAIGAGSDLTPILADRAAAKQHLRHLVGHRQGETIETIRAEIVSGAILPPAHYPDVFAVCQPDPAKSRFEDKLARIDSRNPDPDLILKAFLTADGLVPKGSFPKKDFMQAAGGIGERIRAEAERLAGLVDRMRAARLVARSEALIDVLGSIFDRYKAQKRARALLDFNDLIERMGTLLNDSGARDWVRYKLDANITHILVDESQDTNPEQWAVVRALSDEFFHGGGAVQYPRTLFAVGDKKQSIYSFQGADPRLFSETGRELGARARGVDLVWNDVRLKASFRTLPGVLDAVDKVCATPEIAAALLAEGPLDGHESARTDKGGTVTLWPPVRQENIDLPTDRWPVDKDFLELRNAARIVAERIASAITEWTSTARPLAQRKRAVSPDDVLILVQSRGALFQEIIRALKRAQIPSPGSDRLPVSNHIAVLDLLALADILLNPADDLNLAAVLRSPLFNISEDDLYVLAAGRPKKTSLWRALLNADFPEARDAAERLQRWRGRLDFERPFEFFAEVLYADQGLKRFHARLGEEVDDVLAEFLDLALAHERAPQPSLQGFLAAMRKSDISIKRELAEKGSGVRVMTVHGAKGLEAPIVILADAATGPNVQKLGKPVYLVPDAPGPLLIHASSKKDHVAETLTFRDADEANQRAEYWRKLYVGMTRAEDELYVTGMLTKEGKLEGTWYDAMAAALAPESAPCPTPLSEESGLIFPANCLAPAPVVEKATPVVSTRKAYQVPLLPLPVVPEIIHPSTADDSDEAIFGTAAEAVVDAERARKQGIALHALLQHLSRLDPAMREQVAARALDVLLPEYPQHHITLTQKALSILDNPHNTQLFGPQSRAEVPFLAAAEKAGAPKRIAGRIDRLVVTDTHVLAVDFKSDAVPAERPEDIAPGYITQLGLYTLVGKKLFAPRRIDAAIFWTATETLMPIPANLLEDATASFTLV